VLKGREIERWVIRNEREISPTLKDSKINTAPVTRSKKFGNFAGSEKPFSNIVWRNKKKIKDKFPFLRLMTVRQELDRNGCSATKCD
jgi:hypothetical protein